MKKYKIYAVLVIFVIVLGFSLRYLYDWYLVKKLDTSFRERIDAHENCIPLLHKCRYLDPRWQLTGFDAKKDADLQVLQKYENAIENCIKPLSVLKRSNNQNFRICYEKNTYFRNKVDEMEREILSEIDSCKARLERRKEDLIKFLNSFDPNNQEHIYTIERNSELILYLNIDVPIHVREYVNHGYNGTTLKPHPRPLHSFLEGKSQEEIFSMYESFAIKYDRQNKTHQAELKRWTSDPLFSALKKDDNWVEKIYELEEKMLAKK